METATGKKNRMPFDTHLEKGVSQYLRVDYKRPFYEFPVQKIKTITKSESVMVWGCEELV
jgi:hypothetical protein